MRLPGTVPAVPWDVECGVEIRLFDPRRNPRDWTDLIRPTECAVFLKARTNGISLAPDGQPYSSQAQVACILFHRLDAAQVYCEGKVRSLPHLRCEIYDAEGLAHPPLMVILHPEFQRSEDAGQTWSRRRKWSAAVVCLVAMGLFWISTRASTSRDIIIFLAINCILLALRFVYWDFGLKHSERERLKRLEHHRKMEKGDA